MDNNAGVQSTLVVDPHHDAYPRVLDVHSWVSHEDEVLSEATKDDAYPEVLDVHTQVSRDIDVEVATPDYVLSDRDVYPDVLNVHSLVSRDAVLEPWQTKSTMFGTNNWERSRQ